jgi:hypothetical protein
MPGSRATRDTDEASRLSILAGGQLFARNYRLDEEFGCEGKIFRTSRQLSAVPRWKGS